MATSDLNPTQLMLVGILIALLGAFLISLYFSSENAEKEFEKIRQNGITTNGLVTSVKELIDYQVQKGAARKNFYAPIIEFYNTKNEKITFTSLVYFPEDMTYPKVGDTVMVKYNDHLPAKAFSDFDVLLVGEYEEHYQKNALWSGDKGMETFFFIFGGLAFLGMGVLMVYFSMVAR